MGLRITVPDVTFTGPELTAPVVDPMLTAGSLLLIDPAHPVNPWAAGLPSGSVPNVAWEEAAVMAGGDATSLRSPMVSAFVDPTDGKLERTGKGAFHAVVSKTNDVSGHYLTFQVPPLIGTYLAANLGHATYLSLWTRVTRAGGAAALFARLSSATGGIIRQSIQETGSGTSISGSPTSGTTYVGRRTFASPAAGLVNTGVNAAPSTWPGGAGTNPILTIMGPLSASTLHLSPSWVLYRLYLEDLTVSGRTYATVDALDAAQYAAAVTDPGGRYYGDTYTNPTTIP